MNARQLTTLAFVVLVLALTGCLHGPSPEEVRDGFVDSVEDVESYSYEGETQFEMDGGPGTPTQTTTVSTDAAVDWEGRELHAEITSSQPTGNGTVEVETTTYLVNGSVYDWTEGGGDEPQWLRYDNASDVDEEWSSRDELGFYAELLRNASLSEAEESGDAEAAHVFRVEPGPEGRLRLLESKFGDQAAFFSDVEVEEFEMKAWFTEEHRLDRVEAEVSMTRVQEDRTPTILYVDASFEDDFSGYDETVDIELPEEASDAQPVGRVPR